MKNNHLKLLLTSCLLSTSAIAMPGELSDALNGIGKHDKATVARKLHEKADKRAQVLKQTREFYGNFVLCEGGEVYLERSRAALTPLINAAEKARYQEEFYNSYDAKGHSPVLAESTRALKGQPHQSGKHIRMVRALGTLTNEIVSLVVTQSVRPAQKQVLVKEKEAHQNAIEKLQREREEAEHQVRGLKHTQVNLSNTLGHYSDAIKEENTDLQEVEERIEAIGAKVAAPFIGHDPLKLKQYHEEKEELEKALALVEEQDNEEEGSDTDASVEDQEATGAPEESTDSSVAEQLKETLVQIAEDVKSAPLPPSEPIPDPATEERKQRLAQIIKEIDTIEIDQAARRDQSIKIKEQYASEIVNLEEKKKEHNAKILQLNEKHRSLNDQILKDVNEPLGKLEGVLQQKTEEMRKIGTQLEEVDIKLRPFDAESAALFSQLAQKRAEKQKLQDDADLYALIKYERYMNLYLALPNDDIEEDDYAGSQLSTLSSEDIPLMQTLTETRVTEVAMACVREAVERETHIAIESSLKSAVATCENPKLEIESDLNWRVTYRNAYKAEDVTKTVLEAVTAKFDIGKMKSVYKKASPVKKRYAFSIPPKTQIEYINSMVEGSEPLRADRQLKAAALKWKARVTTGKDSLVQRMGLNSAFISPTFAITTNRPLLSLTTLRDSLMEDVLKAADTKADWKLVRNQLQFNYDFTDKESPVHTRITPITKFVEEKVKKERKKGETFAKKFAAADSKEALVQKAFLKMTSYMTMAYALTHDEEGQATPELMVMSPDIEAYVKPDAIPASKRVDNVMAKKALKWADRVWEYGQEFIKEHGLKAWIFDAYKGEI